MNRLTLLILGGALLGATLGLPGCTSAPEADRSVEVVAEAAAWTWFTDERAIVADSTLYVGHVDTAGAVGVTTRALGDAQADGRDTTARLSSFREVDDHDNPALLQLDDGRVLATYAQHHEEPYWYWRSERPGTGAVEWSDEGRTDSLAAPVTYSNLFQLSGEDGRLYNFFRALNFDPTLMTSADGGETWDAPRHLLVSGDGGTRPYVKYASDGEGRIDLLYTQAHPRQAATDVYHAFYEDGTFHQSDGTPICQLDAADCLPIEVQDGTQVYDADTAGRAWVWDLDYAASGAPVGVYVAARDSTVGNDLRYRYARYDGSTEAWTEQEIAHAGTRLYDDEHHYAGGIALDPADPARVYASADVHPASGDSTASGRYQLYRGERSEEGWDWTQVTDTPGADNLRPFVPRRSADGSPIVLWMRGEYTSYTDYDTNIVGLLR
ncbi:MAG: BNR-4 repeat-containing protein [Salinivenus sp.]